MEQIQILYFILSFLVGLVSLSVLYFIYFSTKTEKIKPFIFFYTTFTLLVIFNFITSYLRANIPDHKSFFYYFLLYLENPAALSILIFAIPYFVHSIIHFNAFKKRNRVFLIIALITFVFHNAFRLSAASEYSNYAMLVKNIVFISVIFYCFILLLRYLKKNKFLKTLLFLWILIFPAVINDIFLLDKTGIKIFPVIYSIIGIIFARHFYLELAADSKPTGTVLQDVRLPDNFMENSALSKREVEVVQLLIEGKSYKEISRELFISINTVKTHIRNIYPKLKVSSRHEIVNLFISSKNGSKINDSNQPIL